jgi:hypothetical protein
VGGQKRPSFLKRQKEQQRRARADEKREARRARKKARTEGTADPDVVEYEDLFGSPDDAEESEG